MKNNTALKKLILKLKYERSQFVSEKGKYAINHAIELAELLLLVEKKQIKDAFNEGYRNAEQDLGTQNKTDISKYENAEQYLKETYK